VNQARKNRQNRALQRLFSAMPIPGGMNRSSQKLIPCGHGSGRGVDAPGPTAEAAFQEQLQPTEAPDGRTDADRPDRTRRGLAARAGEALRGPEEGDLRPRDLDVHGGALRAEAAERKAAVEVRFMDEASVGRKGMTTRTWAMCAHRPRSPARCIRRRLRGPRQRRRSHRRSGEHRDDGRIPAEARQRREARRTCRACA